jgi:hypothetical protein
MRMSWKLGLLIAVLAGCAPASQWRRVPSGVPVVRVLLARDVGRVTLGADGPYRVSYSRSSGESVVLSQGETLGVEWAGRGRVLVRDGSGETGSEHSLPLRVVGVDHRTSIAVAGEQYRGAIELKKGNGGFLVVNEVDVESYLRGVVPAEVGYLEENAIEAVKAQAVAARTYALKRVGRGTKDYDLEATVTDQVYKGKSAEQNLADRALRETEGVVAVYRGKLIDA